ncbi:unnamed protein product [Adineta ricciae]|uniref:Uncharacterized protein n=1 Tax=Adineta ricciae TaxID=249248 RepID=A0A813Q7S1_ADIRI|nr:unnamed protein product [Adineta ricciae]CAF1357862.1 unnamed protein product [Adineta ricciae]
MNQVLQKRDLARLTLLTNTSTLADAQMVMNASIQYALEQQLLINNYQDQSNISILQMSADTDDSSNMRSFVCSVTLDFVIMYTHECLTCDQRRQLIIFNQLCSYKQLSSPIYFLIQNSNLSYTVSSAITVYTPYISIENIVVVTIFSAKSCTMIVSTSKSNYIATLDATSTQTSASQNDGPVPLVAASTMYPALTQIIERQAQFPNGSNAFNITISNVILQFWYSNSTIQMISDFMINFATSCDTSCMNQRNIQITSQLGSLTNTSIYMQPANMSNGQVQILKNGVYASYDYSLTTQVITNFSGTIVHTSSPTLTIIY